MLKFSYRNTELKGNEMAAIIFSEIVESNQITITAMDDEPMRFIVRINGNLRTMRDVIYQMGREAFRIERGPIIGMPG